MFWTALNSEWVAAFGNFFLFSPASSCRTVSHIVYFQRSAGNDEQTNAISKVNATSTNENAISAISLQTQAQKLRQEADQMRKQLESEKAQSLAKRTAKVDSWIEKLLVAVQVDDRTQLLKSEDEVLRRLQEDRFSQEQINAIFNRLCETGSESRSNCSPLMELLVDSVGKMDQLERKDNPNKRWSGKVERLLRRRLFAMDWNMDIDEDDSDDRNPWRLG